MNSYCRESIQETEVYNNDCQSGLICDSRINECTKPEWEEKWYECPNQCGDQKQNNYFECSTGFSEHCQTTKPPFINRPCKKKDCKNRNQDCLDQTDCSSGTTCINQIWNTFESTDQKKCFFTEI